MRYRRLLALCQQELMVALALLGYAQPGNSSCVWRATNNQTVCEAGVEFEAGNTGVSAAAQANMTLCCKLRACRFANLKSDCDTSNKNKCQASNQEYLLGRDYEPDRLIAGARRCANKTQNARLCCKNAGLQREPIRVILEGMGWNREEHDARDDEMGQICVDIRMAGGAGKLIPKGAGACFRVYAEPGCTGLSRAVHYHLEPTKAMNLHPLLNGRSARSLSPCFPYDQYPSLRPLAMPSNRIGPAGGLRLTNANWGARQPRPVFQLGFQDRPEMVQVELETRHIGAGRSGGGEQLAKFHLRGRDLPGDKPAYLVPPALGGTSSEPANLFAQNATQFGTGELQLWEELVMETLAVNGRVNYTMNLVYEKYGIRPLAINARLEFTDARTGERRLMLGGFPNL